VTILSRTGLPLQPLLHPACDAGDGDDEDEKLGTLEEALLRAKAAGVEREGCRGLAWAASRRAVVIDWRQGVTPGQGTLSVQTGRGGDDTLQAMDFIVDFGGAPGVLTLSFGSWKIQAGEDVIGNRGATGADAFVGHDSGEVEGWLA
jgi:hypothetical protein